MQTLLGHETAIFLASTILMLRLDSKLRMSSNGVFSGDGLIDEEFMRSCLILVLKTPLFFST